MITSLKLEQKYIFQNTLQESIFLISISMNTLEQTNVKQKYSNIT